MMNGNYNGEWMGNGWMGGGGGWWMMTIGVLVCIAIIGAVVWLVMRSLKNKQAPPMSSIPQQQHPYQMDGQEHQPSSQQLTETYQEGEKEYSYPQPVQYPQQQERPLN